MYQDRRIELNASFSHIRALNNRFKLKSHCVLSVFCACKIHDFSSMALCHYLLARFSKLLDLPQIRVYLAICNKTFV